MIGKRSVAAQAAFFMAVAAFGSVSAASAASAVNSWTGFYVGANAGYGWGSPSSSMQYLFNGAPTSFASVGQPQIPDSYPANYRGFIGGGQAGYNFQINNVVLGVETDLSFSGLKSDTTVTGTVPGPTNFTSTRSQKLDWFGTLRARAGFTPNDMLLLYVTGGLAFGQVKDSTQLSFLTVGGTTYAGSASSTRAGWTLGAGAEYRMSRTLSAKFEYLYFDLGKTTVNGLDVTSPGNPFQTNSEFNHTGHIFRVGINFMFGGGQ
jgi:outer membrane immunogenic protein